jgi:hypothetical protein
MFSILISKAKIRIASKSVTRKIILPAPPRNLLKIIPSCFPTLPYNSSLLWIDSECKLSTPKKEDRISPLKRKKFDKWIRILKSSFLKNRSPQRKMTAGNKIEKYPIIERTKKKEI